MHLTNAEERALEGERGEALASSYRVLAAMGEYLGADRLIPIASAHISGVNYANIGDEGLDFLELFGASSRVVVKTTLNPCGIELDRPESLGAPADFVEKQRRIVELYAKMGIITAMSCVPYESENKPRRGSHAAWAESSASIYGNSVLGIMTNRESAISSLASALTGKVPNAGMHRKENRVPGMAVSVEARLGSYTDYGLLGLFAGRLSSKPIGFLGLKKLDRFCAKALGAGIGTSGSSPMFMRVAAARGLEKVGFGEKEMKEMRAATSSGEDAEMVLLGCPFYSLPEVRRLAGKVEGKKMKRPTYLHLSRPVYAKAEAQGLVGRLRKAGVGVFKDACPSLTPIGAWNGASRVATDSPKGSYYMKTALKYKVAVMSVDDIVSRYT
ncbi:MAG: aconitase X catalytic domain-containing protein [Nitrososphaerota archaeon]|nr:aconitase X catalytic domain-containing protein [Nitrososphaerota archaeon]